MALSKTKQAPRPMRRKANNLKPKRRKHHLRAWVMGEGLPNLTALHAELQDMTDVLMGRVDPPINAGELTLMEVADGYFARASEITMLIQSKERTGQISRGDPHYKFRTGELRTFMDMAKGARDLGSRRLTKEQLRFEMERVGSETKGRY